MIHRDTLLQYGIDYREPKFLTTTMSKYVNITRVHRAIVNLEAWRDEVNFHTSKHIWQFLTLKWRGVSTDDWTDFGELDDKAFWETFMRVRSGEDPNYDPVTGKFRIEGHYHSNVATMRKNTFANRWGAAAYEEEDDSSTGKERWKLNPDYLDHLLSELSKGGSFTEVPLWDIIAWIYRERTFDDDASLDDVKQQFVDQFNLTTEEREKFFTTDPIDHKSETGGDFFQSRPPNRELIEEAAASKHEFDLTNALEDVRRPDEGIRMERDGVHRLLETSNKQVILQGPPGSGKTYMARQIAAEVLGADEVTVENDDALDDFLAEKQWSNISTDGDGIDRETVAEVDSAGGTWDLIQFHPNYTYEDFVRGIVSEVDDTSHQPVFHVENKIFGELAALSEETDTPIVLVIDEINRADLSKVLGELIYALEYRGSTVSTPYEVDGSKNLTVGENIRIVGTMNTADRSIALIDYAIRRRFDFVDVTPEKAVLENYLLEAAPEVAERTLEVFDEIQTLFEDVPDYAVGHAYFMGDSGEEIANKIVFEVLPLLAEYRKEGILPEHVQVELDDWPGTGLPVRHSEPFELVDQLESWLSGASATEIAETEVSE
jgi:MoxR-like ATPase